MTNKTAIIAVVIAATAVQLTVIVTLHTRTADQLDALETGRRVQ